MTYPPIGVSTGTRSSELWRDGEADDRSMMFGLWQMALRGAEIADLQFDGLPVLRSLRFIVRDHDWRTAENDVIRMQQNDAVVSMSVLSSFDGHPVVEWTATILVAAARLRYAVDAQVLGAFRRNRIGLIILHHPDLAGTPVEVWHPDGASERTVFPQQIAPHQPARRVAGYRWHHDGLRCALSLSGDLFEMEDQRNWTDASYKTYSTPLSDPFPVGVDRGERISQSVELTCSTEADHGRLVGPAEHMIIPSTAELPVLQVGAATGPDTPADTGIINDLPVLVEVPADERCWPAVLDRAATDTNGELDLRIIAASADQLEPVINTLRTASWRTRVVRIGVYHRTTQLAESDLLDGLTTLLDEAGSAVEVVAGTRAHFTELNRGIAAFEDWAGALSFSLTPQMHDRSRAQLIESIRMQRIIAEQAVRMADGRPVHVGPVTLRPRFNAVATTAFVPSDAESVVAGYGPQRVPGSTDPRQYAPAVAAWTVATVAALSVPGIDSITLFESWGPRGIRASRVGPIGPTGCVIDWLRSGGRLVNPIIEVAEPAGSMITSIAQQTGAIQQVVIGNLGSQDALVRMDAGSEVEVESIGNPSMIINSDDRASGFVFRIPAFSTARVRSEVQGADRT